jgi:16S rRNA (uracil1498-N3)-methyltransferase
MGDIRMYHFFVGPSQICGKNITILGEDVNHIKNVLRMKPGDELSVSDGADQKEYRCGIVAFTEDSVVCELRFIKEDGLELPCEVTLFQALPKADKMEFIIQKCVELGIYSIVPVAAHRCVVKLDDKKAAAKTVRWQAIAESAAKQSRRGMIPQVHVPVTMREAVEMAGRRDVKLIPYELAEGMSHTKQLINGIRPGQSVAVFIGPEGGFEDAEIKYATGNGIEPVTLGRRILRTETAGMTVMSWIMYQLEQD